MSRIYVCGLDEMLSRVGRLRPDRMVSLLPADEQPPTPPAVRPDDHLRVLINDYDEPREGPDAPRRDDVEALVGFLRATPPQASILFHCLAGVSRSPAAALVAMALEAPGREREAALCMREAAPFVMPNRLIVELADRVLGRDGALVEALDAMGPPDWSLEHELFTLPRRLPDGPRTAGGSDPA